MDGGAYLTTGLYTVSDAVRLLRRYRVSGQGVRGWVSGYPRTRAAPIIDNEVGFLGGHLAMGFINLMEVRFIAYFADKGVKVASLRYMAEEAKQFLRHPHPFATKTIFATDGKIIFAKSAKATGDPRMYDLKAKNWAFYRIIAQSLLRGVEFNPGGTARAWYPDKKLTPNIVLDPMIAFGQPVINESRVPTEALFDSFNAEGETYESVAGWFDMPVGHVRQAVQFETEYARAV